MSKYNPLWNHLMENRQNTYELSYKEIETILGFPIDYSFLTLKKELKEYGYVVIKIPLKTKKVTFKKITS